MCLVCERWAHCRFLSQSFHTTIKFMTNKRDSMHNEWLTCIFSVYHACIRLRSLEMVQQRYKSTSWPQMAEIVFVVLKNNNFKLRSFIFCMRKHILHARCIVNAAQAHSLTANIHGPRKCVKSLNDQSMHITYIFAFGSISNHKQTSNSDNRQSGFRPIYFQLVSLICEMISVFFSQRSA